MIGRTTTLFLAGLLTLGCASAYGKTYEEETRSLEAAARAEQESQRAADQAAYDEASRHAAVVYFDTGSAVIGEDGYRELGWFAKQVAGAPPRAEILVQGFADATASDALNQGLSQDRARAVASHLESLGIARSRLMVQGFSSNFPAADNAQTAGRRNNRRVEVTLR